MVEWGRKGEKKKLCQKRKAKCCDKPKGGKPSPFWCFPPINLNTTVAFPKDVQKTVCTNKMRDFVIPTLSIF
jgi:hypothetical protein